jgi:hypothetical protein
MKKLALFFYRIIKKYLPQKINYFIWDIYLSNISSKSYSQYGEDLIICNYFKKVQGNYLDIGCYHPKGISNTHLLHKNGWKGVVVDIDDYKLNLFKKRRGSNIEVIKGAISASSSDHKVPVYKFNKPFSPYDTLSKEIADLRSKQINIEYKVDEIDQIDINTLLNKKHFDFINIDVEGLDEIIINSIDFDKYQPKMIVYESFEPFLPSKTKELLSSNGYTLLFITGGSLGFIKG